MAAASGQQADSSPGGVQYARHRPEEALLYQVIDDSYPEFLAQIEAEGRTLPRFVLRVVFQTMVLGTSTRKVPVTTTQGLAPTANATGAESEMTLVVVQPTEAPNSTDSLFEEFVSRGSLLKDLPIALISPDPTPTLKIILGRHPSLWRST